MLDLSTKHLHLHKRKYFLQPILHVSKWHPEHQAQAVSGLLLQPVTRLSTVESVLEDLSLGYP